MKERHVYSGGNTCEGFYHFYHTMAREQVHRKFILKGGPGVGKSSFMQRIGQYFTASGYDLEYHWCSSDPDSLDGILIGNDQFCFLDGTNPHIIDPRYPGAVDEIINLGQFWTREKIEENRHSIVRLTDLISKYFQLAYLRFYESGVAWQEMQFYTNEAIHWQSVNKNILALGADFLGTGKFSSQKPRHLFAAAITPDGLITKLNSLVKQDYDVFSVSGPPGCGLQELFSYLLKQIKLNSLEAEVFHNPFDPSAIDLILFPRSKSVIIDISAHVIDYVPLLPGKHKRRLDFDLFINRPEAAEYNKYFLRAKNRFSEGIKAGVEFLRQAKSLHDELESLYIPHMNFFKMEECSTSLCRGLEASLKKS